MHFVSAIWCKQIDCVLNKRTNRKKKENYFSKMAPTRKSLPFLTLRSTKVNNSKENTFLYRLSDFSSTINRRKSMRLALAGNLKNIVSIYILSPTLFLYGEKFALNFSSIIHCSINLSFISNRKSTHLRAYNQNSNKIKPSWY